MSTPAEPRSITAFECGPKHTCPDGTPHDYSRWEELPDGGGTAVCITCGHHAISDAYWD